MEIVLVKDNKTLEYFDNAKDYFFIDDKLIEKWTPFDKILFI